jgi:hypothetical protein
MKSKRMIAFVVQEAQLNSCAVLDVRKKKLTVYPLGKLLGGHSPFAWAAADAIYTVEFEAGAFSDADSTGLALANPIEHASFTFQAVTFFGSADSTNFNASEYLPIASFQPPHKAQRMFASTNITLGFVENIVQGAATGKVHFCLNSDAELDGDPACIPGRYEDGSFAEIDVKSAVFKSSSVIFNPPKDFMQSQTLYVLLPNDIARAANSAARSSQEMQASDYSFHIADRDTLRPFLNYYQSPSTMSGTLRLYFSEAVQASGNAIEVFDASTDAKLTGLPEPQITGNEITISTSWTAGGSYRLQSVKGELQDLSGNEFMGRYAFDGANFEEVEAPNITGGCEQQSVRRLAVMDENMTNMTTTEPSNTTTTTTTLNSTTTTSITTTNNDTFFTNDNDSNASGMLQFMATTPAPSTCDDAPPHISYMSPAEGVFDLPLNVSETNVYVSLRMSKPVRLEGEIQILREDLTNVPLKNEPFLMADNRIAIHLPPEVLIDKMKFIISLADGVVVDTTGAKLGSVNKTMIARSAPGQVLMSSIMFSVSADVTPPQASLDPSPSSPTFHLYDSITIQFNEVVQQGTGNVFIDDSDQYLCQITGCQNQVMSTEASSLPLLSRITSGKLSSFVFLWGNAAPVVKLYPGHSYTVGVPSSAFLDAAGNKFTGLDTSASNTLMTTLRKDTVKPKLLFADMGGRTPNPTFTSPTITLYFSEAVYAVKASVNLKGSNGGSFCSSTVSKGCFEIGEECSSPCSYTPAASDRSTVAWIKQDSGASAVVELDVANAAFSYGFGYKIEIEAGTFTDMIGNENDAVDGQAEGYVMQVPFPSPAAVLVSTWPFNNTQFVPPSTMVRLTFDQAVQQGSGNVEIGPHSVPASSCHVEGASMTCTPPSPLQPNVTYVVRFDSGAIQDLSGSAAKNAEFHFTVIDSENVAPVHAVAPLANETLVAKGQLVTLTFSQTVQIGSGSIIVSDCTQQGMSHSISVGESIDSSDYKLYLSDRHVYIDQPNCMVGQTFSLTTDHAGVFQDAAGLPLAKLTSGFVYHVVPNDENYPQVFLQYPVAGATDIYYSPTSAITLYFSEAVQKSAAQSIQFTMNGQTFNPNVETADGNIVRIEPPEVTQYSSSQLSVTVSIPFGTFKSLAENPAPSLTFTYYTQPFVFSPRKLYNENAPFSPREGSVMYQINSTTLIMYGGKDNNGCKSDLWRGSLPGGASWTLITSVANTTTGAVAPMAAHAPTAIDKYGCIWLLGGECNYDKANLWQSCDGGSIWNQLPTPKVSPVGFQDPPPLPLAWHNHAITIAGGWQLVIVSAASSVGSGACVWKATDPSVEYLQCVHEYPLAFGVRSDPKLMAMSDTTLVLVGGHLCNDVRCSNNIILTDVWESHDMGANWQCQTMHYTPDNPSFETQYSHGIGRFMSVLMLRDDTILLMGGMRSNSTRGSNLVYVSAPGVPDTQMNRWLLRSPAELSEDEPRLGTNPTLYFREYVERGPGSIELQDLDMSVAVPVEVSINGPAVTLIPMHMLHPNRDYSVRLAQDSIKDLAGNFLSGDVSYTFTVSRDQTPPTISRVYPQGTGVSLRTTFLLTFLDDVSDVVLKGSGGLTIYPTNASLRANHSDIHIGSGDFIMLNKLQALCALPSGLELLPGTEYNMHISEGLVTDQAMNNVSSSDSFFTTVSADIADMAAPTVINANPQNNQVDFLVGTTEVDLVFSESVKVLPGSNMIIRHYQKILDDVMISTSSASVSGGLVRFPLPTGSLQAGVNYEILVPPGAIFPAEGIVAFPGINESTHMFTTSIIDIQSPELFESQLHPQPEGSSFSFSVNPSTPFKLTFSEAIQAGADAGADSEIRFVPTYHTENITVKASEAIIQSNIALVIPPKELMPGDKYHVTIGSRAFRDLAFNFYQGLSSGYSISTAPRMKFIQAPGTHWQSEISSGERYGMAAAVDPNNMVILAGGRRGDANGDHLLNDVWTLDTKRETTCASSFTEPHECPLTRCRTGESGKPSLGLRKLQNSIWRPPSAGGQPCLAPDGGFRSRLGDLLIDEMEECPCPVCISPPVAPLPTDMANTSYLESYTLVSANSTPMPLLCRTGYVPTGPFMCIPESPYLGVYERPYPRCKPAPCNSPPPRISQFAEFSLENSTDNMNCSLLTPSNSMPHFGECGFKCQSGWMSPTGFYKCRDGTFTTPVCVRQMCLSSEPLVDNAYPLCGESGGTLFGEMCTTPCKPGYRLFTTDPQGLETEVPSIQLICDKTSDEAEAEPRLQYPASQGTAMCKKNICAGNYSGSMEGASITYPADMSLDSPASITCEYGYVPYEEPEVYCKPVEPDKPGSPFVGWRNSTAGVVPSLCRMLKCDPPTDPYGTYTNFNGVGMNEVWKLECNPGWETPSKSDPYARCSPEEVLTKPEQCVFTGGCNGTTEHNSEHMTGPGVNGTTCDGWMKEGAVCSVTCSTGEPVGQFTCVMMEIAGESICAEAGAETISVTMLAGSFTVTAELPQNADVGSQTFVEMIKGSLSEGLGLWPADFSRFFVKLKQDRQDSAPSRRLGASRRLALFTFEVSYELMVRDLSKLGQLQRDLGSLDRSDSTVAESFSRTLLANGCQVLAIAVTRTPTHFQGTVLMPKDTGSSSSDILTGGAEADSALRTGTIAGGFIGAMVGLTLITTVIYIITRETRRKGRA